MSPPESYLYWFRNAARRRYLLAMDLASTASRQETSRDSNRTHLAYSWRKACRPYRNASAEGIHIFGANCPCCDREDSGVAMAPNLGIIANVVSPAGVGIGESRGLCLPHQ